MNKLSPEQQAKLRKMATARLIIKLNELGISDDDLEKMDRTQMLNIYAEANAEGRTETNYQYIWPGDRKI